MNPPNYRKPNTSSPQERAMVAAANALVTPISDAGRFEMMAFNKEALEALDQCHHSDQITREIVFRKIGEAQARQGFQEKL